MEKPENRTHEYFKELAWLLLLGNVAVALAGVVVGRQLEDVRLGVMIYLGGAGFLTLGVLVIVGINWIIVVVKERLQKHG
jgi:hypothetical protein